MNTDNVVEFLRQLSLDVSLGAAAQQAASQRDAPLALARLATAHGLPAARPTGPHSPVAAWTNPTPA